MITTELICPECNSQFEKLNKEISRQRKKKGENILFFCSQSCATTYHNKHSDKIRERYESHKGVIPFGFENGVDEYSPYRYFLRKANNRNKECDLDLPYLKELWEKQNGICSLSGIKMKLPATGKEWEGWGNDPDKPSLDRIDSSKGYTKGNVRFITYMANMCKSTWTDEQVIEFCKATANNWIR